jgi:hypothetical protein
MSFHIAELGFWEHAKLKIKERTISSLDVSTVLKTPLAVYIDVETGYFITTIIDTTKLEMVKKRVEKGRWVKVK